MQAAGQTTRAIAPEGRVPAKGTELFYRSIGEGTVVVAIHGGPGLGHYYLRPGMDTLADAYQLVYYDQRGTGRSELGDPERVSLAGSIEDLLALLDGLGIERANLLGHSFGADLLALFASRHPDRVSSLVLANPGPPFDPEKQSLLWAEMERRRTPQNREEMARIEASEGFVNRDPAVLEARVRQTYEPFFNDPAIGAGVSYGFTEITAANFLESDRTFRDLDPAGAIAGLSAISAPTLVIHAEHDPIPEAFSQEIANAIPGSHYEVIPDVNHFAYMEDPEVFFAPVREFLMAEAR